MNYFPDIHQNEKPPKLENISDKMNGIVLKCLEKKYSDRFKDFEEIIKQFGGNFVKATFIQPNTPKTSNSTSSRFVKTLTTVLFNTKPNNATLYLVDSKKGIKTPINQKFAVGTHKIKIVKEGYATIEDEIIISETSSNEFYVELESTLGSITVETKKQGQIIWLNGKKTKYKTPHTFEEIIPHKKYHIQVFGNRLFSKLIEIEIENNQNKKISINEFNEISTPKNMVFVESGTFQMGSENGNIDEKPIHEVTLSDFFIGKFQVTQKEYSEIMGVNPSYFKDEIIIKGGFLGFGKEIEELDKLDSPVENVTWYDAVEFCNKKSEKEGLEKCYSGSGETIKCDFTKNGYRLPTEAEWEYAARGGNKSKGYKYSGSNNINEVAWYSKNFRYKPHAVGGKKPNELGIYDMSGNIAEWCWDWFGSYSSSSQKNPTGASSSSYRVNRGGHTSFCRVVDRDHCSPYNSYNNLGFRYVRR